MAPVAQPQRGTARADARQTRANAPRPSCRDASSRRARCSRARATSFTRGHITEQAELGGYAPPDEGSVKKAALKDQQDVQDKLIAAMQSRPRSEWRKLLAFSEKWPDLSDGVYARLDALTADETDPETKLKLRRFGRGLKDASEDVLRCREILRLFEAAPAAEHETMVAGHHEDLGKSFFEYVSHRVGAADGDKARQEELIELATRMSALCEAFDSAQGDEPALQTAVENFRGLLEASSMADAEKQIDEMAKEGKIDPAFLYTMARAYSGVKETDYTRDDVKETMAHLYVKAKEAAARDSPAEVRILKHLLMIDDPAHRSKELERAFEPGSNLVTPNEDFLHTNPATLAALVDTVLDAYEASRGKGTILGQTADMLHPDVIKRLQELKAEVARRFT